jgi:hypothetical protein
MCGKNIVLTGIPRSGTTFICHLLNKISNSVALHEPLPILKMAELINREGINTVLGNFFQQARTTLIEKNIAPSRLINKDISDNYFSDKLTLNGLRQNLSSGIGAIKFNKTYDQDLTIIVKHNASFSALLNELKNKYPCYAVIRNPLSVLLSWQTTDIPINRGRLPAGEAFSEKLKYIIKSESNLLTRQINILHWFFGEYKTHLSDSQIICYEKVIENNGAVLSVITPDAIKLKEDLSSRNKNPLYPKELYYKIGIVLLNSQGPIWDFYEKSEIEALISNS